MKLFWCILITVTTLSCNSIQKEEEKISNNEIPVVITTDTIASTPEEKYITHIEEAHKKKVFLAHEAISFDIDVRFGGQPYFNGKITMLTDATKIRIDKKDGSILFFDGEKVLLCPEDTNSTNARFDMFTWSYFFGMPYKLSDPGTQWELKDTLHINELPHNIGRLTFASGIGDTPNDWYMTYTDTKTNLLKAAAYIISFGSNGDTTKAEADPHAIQYKEFTTIAGIPFATQWQFHGWSEKEGMGKQIGSGSIQNIMFLTDTSTIFETPKKAKEIPLE